MASYAGAKAGSRIRRAARLRLRLCFRLLFNLFFDLRETVLELGLPPHGIKRSITGTDNAKAEDDGTKSVFTKLANAKMLVMR